MSRLEELKKFPSLVPHNTILNYCPYYYEIEEYLKGIQFPQKYEVINFAFNNYRECELYSTLAAEGKSRESIRYEILDNTEFRYNQLLSLVKESIERSIKFCELIGYIANYPTTYPVPKEEEKKFRT